MTPARIFATILTAAAAAGPLAAQSTDLARWKQEAADVTIIRDDWGIAHVYGKTDADAVFGMEYAQAEDDFNRVETNYLTALGRTAEADGARAIYQDLRQRLYIDPDSLKAEYARSPVWLRRLMDAFADGLNDYLATHPGVKPKVITRFEPWMALSFTEGSIGGDIERISVPELAAFYGGVPLPAGRGRGRGGDGPPDDAGTPPPEPSGSNGIAIAPSNTADHHALLWINPHTSFYFRSELQMVSGEGLDAYGAVTWGQFFIYQGFNTTAGWMHTSSGVDNIDQFLETVGQRDGTYFFKFGNQQLPVVSAPVTIAFRTDSGMARKTFTVYYIQQRPVVAKIGDHWVTEALMKNHIDALIQSYTRTKAKDYAAFRKIMALHTNSSNNTIFADAEGNIAYFHSNYIPKRDTAFDWTRPVDGSNPATAYHGLLSIDETPHLLNPSTGFIYNSNNWPWSAAGSASPDAGRFPEVRRNRHRGESARVSRAAPAPGPEGFHDGVADRGGIRQLPAGVRDDDSGAAQGIRRPSRHRSAHGAGGRPDRAAPGLGLPLGGGVGADIAGGVLGERRAAAGRARRPRRRDAGHGLRLQWSRARGAGAIAGRGVGPTDPGFRQLEDALGRHQPVPAAR